MIFNWISSIKYQVSFDEAFDELQIQGTLEGDAWIPCLTENEVINNHWKQIGSPTANFHLTVFREEDSEGNRPKEIASKIKASISFSKNEKSEGSGTIRLHPLIFDKLLTQIRGKHEEMRMLFVGKGAKYTENYQDSFKCEIHFDVLKTIFDLK
jgi:hypothetical protein